MNPHKTDNTQVSKNEKEEYPVGYKPPIQDLRVPKWAKVLLILYSTYFSVVILLAGYSLISKVISRNKELFEVLQFDAQSFFGTLSIAVFVLSGVVLVLEAMYIIRLLDNKRWTIPITLFFGLHTIVYAVLFLIYSGFPSNIENIYVTVFEILKIPLMLAVGFVVIKYWISFKDSAVRIFLQALIVLPLIPMMLFAYLTLIFVDDSSINDADLLLNSVAVVREADNAFYSIPDLTSLDEEKAKEVEYAVDFAEMIRGKDVGLLEGDELSQATEHVEKTEQLISDFIEASKKEAYQCPTAVNQFSYETVICSLNSVRKLAYLTTLKAAIQASTSPVEEAVETSMAIVRMSYLLSSVEQQNLIEHLVAIAIMRIGLETLEDMVPQLTATSSDFMRKVDEELEMYKFDGSAIVESLKREYNSAKKSFAPLAEYSSYLYHHNKSMNNYADYIRKQIQLNESSCYEYEDIKREIDVYFEENRWEPTLENIVKPNSIGDIIQSVTAAGSINVRDKECELNELNMSVRKMLKEYVIDIERNNIATGTKQIINNL